MVAKFSILGVSGTPGYASDKYSNEGYKSYLKVFSQIKRFVYSFMNNQ